MAVGKGTDFSRDRASCLGGVGLFSFSMGALPALLTKSFLGLRPGPGLAPPVN